MLFISATNILAEDNNNNSGSTTFIPESGTGKVNYPRTPYVPIICSYNQESIIIYFYEELGDVEITLTNLTTGEEWIEAGNSTIGLISIITSGSSGEYHIVIETEDGGIYSGQYSI